MRRNDFGWVYVLRNEDKYYVGQTNNLERRLRQHKEYGGAKARRQQNRDFDLLCFMPVRGWEASRIERDLSLEIRANGWGVNWVWPW